MFQEKNFFQVGGWIFFKFQGGIDQEVMGGGGGVDQYLFLERDSPMQGGGSFFKWGLRGVLPSMVTLPLFHLHFQNMSLTLCQTKFSKLQKMLLVSHKAIFRENKAVYLCITIQKRARAFVATIQCITFSYSFCDKELRFCGRVFKGIYHENEAFLKATS